MIHLVGWAWGGVGSSHSSVGPNELDGPHKLWRCQYYFCFNYDTEESLGMCVHVYRTLIAATPCKMVLLSIELTPFLSIHYTSVPPLYQTAPLPTSFGPTSITTTCICKICFGQVYVPAILCCYRTYHLEDSKIMGNVHITYM